MVGIHGSNRTTVTYSPLTNFLDVDRVLVVVHDTVLMFLMMIMMMMMMMMMILIIIIIIILFYLQDTVQGLGKTFMFSIF